MHPMSARSIIYTMIGAPRIMFRSWEEEEGEGGFKQPETLKFAQPSRVNNSIKRTGYNFLVKA